MALLSFPYWLTIIMPLVLFGITTIANGNSATAINDPFLAYLQAAGFPAWAGVLAWAASKFSSDMRYLADRLERHEVRTERRLTSLEMLIKTHIDDASKAHDTVCVSGSDIEVIDDAIL